MFRLCVKDLALLGLEFGFSMQKCCHGTPPELIWLDSEDIMVETCNKKFYDQKSRLS